MPPRKRKANPKYDDDVPNKRACTKVDAPVKRSPAPRTAKGKRGDPEWLVTSEKSPLAYEDLHAELCDPQTYEEYTKEDWDDLRSILPEEVPFNPDGYSIPVEFLKYDPDFRRGIREFQEDLSMGRLEPKWQAAAAEAMEERARGDFDTYKENQYEEFWGQKQKLSYDLLAGEATKVKLGTMVENGIFRVGDEIVYSRAIGRKEKRVLIEKECRIVSIGERTLSVAIPPGRLNYLPRVDSTEASKSAKLDVEGREPGAVKERNKLQDTSAGGEQVEERVINGARSGEDLHDDDAIIGNSDSGWDATAPTQIINHDKLIDNDKDPDGQPPISTPGSSTPKTEDRGKEPPTVPVQDPPEGVVLHNILILKHLSDKIIELDGRLDPKDLSQVPAIQIWKLMRVKRNNQDLGTLFEMRDYFYAYKLPKITKASKEREKSKREDHSKTGETLKKGDNSKRGNHGYASRTR